MTGFTGTAAPPQEIKLEDGTILQCKEYAEDGDGTYYTAPAPGGGTVEVHVLNGKEGW